jgi:hypothetical protein
MLNIITRCFSQNRALLLAAVTEYCLQKLDNKCFKLQQDLLEDYLANHARTQAEIIFALGVMRKVCQHPKTSFSEYYLELLQKVLMIHSGKVRDLAFTLIADMINNGVL